MARHRSEGPVGSLVGGADTGSTFRSVQEQCSRQFLTCWNNKVSIARGGSGATNQVTKEEIQGNCGQAA